MKNQLLTTIIVAAAGLTGLVAAEEDSERLTPPAAPYVQGVLAEGDTCKVRIVFPYWAVANKVQDLEKPVVTGTDAKGNKVTFQATRFFKIGLDAELVIECSLAGTEGGELDTHGSLSVTTGDDVAFSAPATLRPEPTQSIEIGGTTFDVSLGNSNINCFLIASLTPRNGELPCAVRCCWQDEEDTGEATPDLTVFDVAAQEGEPGEIRVHYPICIDGKKVLVQTINVTNPHTVSLPLDFHIVTEPMIQTRFQFPQDSGIRVFKQGCSTSLEEDGTVENFEIIELVLDGEGEEFLDDCQVTVEGAAKICCVPTLDPRDPGSGMDKSLYISMFLYHPANAGQVSHSGTLTVKTNKRTLTVPLTTSGNIRTPFRANR